MLVSGLDHVNLRTARLGEMCAFYERILELRKGPRPPFEFGGAWLYAAEKAVVHLVEVAPADPPVGALRLEHFAFSGRGLSGFLERLELHKIEHWVTRLPGFGHSQVSLRDPDGNRLHVDFDPSEG